MENISLIYYFNFALLAYFAVFKIKADKRLLVLVFLYLSVLVAVRYKVGTDYVNYLRLYHDMSFSTLFDDLDEIEYGAFGSMVMLKTVGLGIPWWFFLMSIMTFLTLFKGLERMGVKNPWWCLLIYYSFFFLMNQCNIMQHGAMTGWIWLAFSYIRDRDFKHYLICCLLGASFHILGLFMIPFYWILDREITLKYVIYALGFAFAFNVFFQHFIFNIFDFGFFGSKIHFYQDVYFKNLEVSKSISVGMIAYSLLLVLLYIMNFKKIDDHFRIFRNALFLAIIFQVVFKGTGIFDARIGGVFNISLIVIIPIFFNYLAYNYFKPLKLLTLIYSFVMFIVTTTGASTYYNNGYQFIPYQTILSNHYETNR